jgi:TonB family protein
MLASFLVASAALITTVSLAAQEADQAVKISSNGEFIAGKYPQRALKAGEQGKVAFRLTVEPDGSLGACEVTGSSGYKSLDDETCELILRYARLHPVRNSEGRAVRAVQNGFINWKHPLGAGASASRAAVAAATLPDKITCKTTPTTGSLVRRTKQCMTNREWLESERIARDRALGLIAKGHADKISTE